MKTIYILFLMGLILVSIKSINKSEFKNSEKHANLIFSQLYISKNNLGEKIVSR